MKAMYIFINSIEDRPHIQALLMSRIFFAPVRYMFLVFIRNKKLSLVKDKNIYIYMRYEGPSVGKIEDLAEIFPDS